MLGNIEDCMTKVIRLIANLATEEQGTLETLPLIKSEIESFLSKTLDAINKRSLDKNEEFILNVVSCLTNLLFYDTPSSQLLSHDLRSRIFLSLKPFILATQNEEI